MPKPGISKMRMNIYKRFSAICPGDVWPMTTVANIYYMDGKLDQAIDKYKEALEINPNYGSEYDIAFCFALKLDFDQSKEWINKYIEHESSEYMRPGGRAYRGYLHVFTGQYRDALIDYSFAHDKFKEYHNAIFMSLIDVGIGIVFGEKKDYINSRYYLKNYQRILAAENIPSSATFANFTCEPLLGLLDIRAGADRFRPGEITEQR